MKKQQGFTLIELVVVIIILGILAVVAAPKFINLQGDARVSALNGFKAAIQGANTLVYSKAAIAGKEKEPATTIDIGSGSADLNIAYGYTFATQADLERAMDVTFDSVTDISDAAEIAASGTNDWVIQIGTGADAGVAFIIQRGAPTTCNFSYKQPTASNLLPEYSTVPDASAC
ncbi:type II secretion system protein [Shewanella intestini]|uniref:Type II secretion system protein n=1 Tax=Shewanella intestini TaxID=2017544 RepID=A0ABS5I4W2_9GAMM|nr:MULTISPECIES: type II secretion system protein [Shewanella]MBR9729061.1 type II secretion system protein [Shewanella intestini]MRG37137.1 prepilin-type N-terminal cleavage/methylation domain-containing protein [Shewanella sp. XMDDZSB0408]